MSDYYLRFQTLKDKADEILNLNSGLSQSPPIDIDILAESLGFYVIPTLDFKSTITKDAFLSPSTKEIYVDLELSQNLKFEHRYRFAVAHEIAHSFLHSDYYAAKTKNIQNIEQWIIEYQKIPEEELSLFEYQANVVAGCILIPDKLLDHEFSKALDLVMPQITTATNAGISRDVYLDSVIDRISVKISPIFNVSTQAMIYRFKDLKYLNQIP